MSTSTHLNTYIKEVETKYELAVKHLGDFKLAVDQLRTIYEQLVAGDTSAALTSAETDVKTDVKQVEEITSTSNKKGK